MPDAAGTTLTVHTHTDYGYDGRRNVTSEVTSALGAVQSVMQRFFDDSGRLDCETRRMNPAAFTSFPASACSLGSVGSFGPDRITRNVYDAAGQLRVVQRGYGTSLQQDYATYTYTSRTVTMVLDGCARPPIRCLRTSAAMFLFCTTPVAVARGSASRTAPATSSVRKCRPPWLLSVPAPR